MDGMTLILRERGIKEKWQFDVNPPLKNFIFGIKNEFYFSAFESMFARDFFLVFWLKKLTTKTPILKDFND